MNTRTPERKWRRHVSRKDCGWVKKRIWCGVVKKKILRRGMRRGIIQEIVVWNKSLQEGS